MCNVKVISKTIIDKTPKETALKKQLNLIAAMFKINTNDSLTTAINILHLKII